MDEPAGTLRPAKAIRSDAIDLMENLSDADAAVTFSLQPSAAAKAADPAPAPAPAPAAPAHQPVPPYTNATADRTSMHDNGSSASQSPSDAPPSCQAGSLTSGPDAAALHATNAENSSAALQPHSGSLPASGDTDQGSLTPTLQHLTSAAAPQWRAGQGSQVSEALLQATIADTSANDKPSANTAAAVLSIPSSPTGAHPVAKHNRCSTQVHTDSPAGAAGTALGSRSPQVIKVGARTLVFYGPLACSICGGLGHAANNCNATFCPKCCTYGHPTTRCADACHECGQCHERSDGACSAARCEGCHMYGHTLQQCPRVLCSVCNCYGHTAAACMACQHCLQHDHPTARCPGPQKAPQAAPKVPTATTSTGTRTSDMPGHVSTHNAEPQLQAAGSWLRNSNSNSGLGPDFQPAATEASKDPQLEIERIKRLWAQQESANTQWQTASSSSVKANAGLGSQAQAADDIWGHHKPVDSLDMHPYPAAKTQLASQDVRLEGSGAKSAVSGWSTQPGGPAQLHLNKPQPDSSYHSPMHASRLPAAAQSSSAPAAAPSTAGRGLAAVPSRDAAAELDRIKQLWAAEAAESSHQQQQHRTHGPMQRAQASGSRYPPGMMYDSGVEQGPAVLEPHPAMARAAMGPEFRAQQQQHTATGSRYPPGMQSQVRAPEQSMSTPYVELEPAAVATKASAGYQPLAAAASGAIRAAAMQLAAAVRERVDLDKEAADRRAAARSSSGKKADVNVAGAALVATRGGTAPPADTAAARLQAHAAVGTATARTAAAATGRGTVRAALDAAEGHRVLSTSLPAATGSDSDDDVPPGFEDMPPPGFGDKLITLVPAAVDNVEGPPGFEGRSLRIQAVLSRTKGALTAQLSKQDSTVSAGSGHNTLGQVAPLRSSDSQEQQQLQQWGPSQNAAHQQPDIGTEKPQLSSTTMLSAHATGSGVPGVEPPGGSSSRRSRQKRRYLFVAGAVCRECGAEGHEEADCSTPYCVMCNLFGHAEGRCGSACSTCGWRHPPPLDDSCCNEPCSECALWGHDGSHCPDSQCNRCQCWGHARELCPGYCRKCHMPGHTTETCSAQHCQVCHATNHDESSCPLQSVQHSMMQAKSGSEKLMPWGAQVPLKQQQLEQQPGRSLALGRAAGSGDYEPATQQQQVQRRPHARAAVAGTQDIRFQKPDDQEPSWPAGAGLGGAGDAQHIPPSHHEQQQMLPRHSYTKAAPVGTQDVRFQEADAHKPSWEDSPGDHSYPPSKSVRDAWHDDGIAAAAAPAAARLAAGPSRQVPEVPSSLSGSEQHLLPRRGTGALAKGRRAVAAVGAPSATTVFPVQAPSNQHAAPAAAGGDEYSDDDAVGVPLELDDAESSDSDEYGAFQVSRRGRKRRQGAAVGVPAATAAVRGSGLGLPAAAGKSFSRSSDAVGSGPQLGQAAWAGALQQLLSGGAEVKWRAILPPPSGDRVGPFTSSELLAWLSGSGRPPKGVSSTDARLVMADQGALQLCGVSSKDYNAQKLPGSKFYKPLSALLSAVSAGMSYTPATKADLAKGYPSPGWNEGPTAAAAAAAAATGSRAPVIRTQAAPTGATTQLATWGSTRSSSSGGGAVQAPKAAASQAQSLQGLQQLLGRADVKWRVIVPSGDRLGPYTAADMLAWLREGQAPKGVSSKDAREAAGSHAMLKVCGINAKDYNNQKLPGVKFYKPLDELLSAVSAGMSYTPVTKADLAKGVPAQGWNILA